MKWRWADVQALPAPVYAELILFLNDQAAGDDSIDLTDLDR